MALDAKQREKLQAVLFTFAGTPEAAFDELWAAFFESTAERKARAQRWIDAAKAQSAGVLEKADAIATNQ